MIRVERQATNEAEIKVYLTKGVCVCILQIYVIEMYLINDPGYMKNYKLVRKDNSGKNGKRY